jgi:hypothetical protein
MIGMTRIQTQKLNIREVSQTAGTAGTHFRLLRKFRLLRLAGTRFRLYRLARDDTVKPVQKTID